MFFKNRLIMLGAMVSLSGAVFADGFNFNNPDGLTVDVVDENNTSLYHSMGSMDGFGWTPQTDYVTVTAKNADNSEVFRKDFRTSLHGNGPMCNYTLLLSEYEGYKHEMSSLSSRGCTPNEDSYHPNTGVPKYTLDNASDHVFNPSFRKEGEEFAADSVHGWVRPGEIRTYTPDDAYWSSPSVNIHEGDILSTAAYDPYSSYIICEDNTPAMGTKTFVYKKVNGEYTCTLKATTGACENAWQENKLYEKGDIVSYQGVLWEARFISYGFPPSNWLWKEVGTSECN